MTVFNRSKSAIEAIVRYGSAQTPKKIVIPKDGKESVNSGIHEFQSIIWHGENSGVYSTLPIPSTRTMLNGKLMIGSEGAYIINFNSQGTYKEPQTEYGLSSNTRQMRPNGMGSNPLTKI
jgi:hypothetical protein